MEHIQAGALPYRVREGRTEVLLITTAGGHWSIPKGLVDPGETAPQAAAREAREEAGVEGDVVGPPVGEYSFDKWGGTCRVTVYLLRVVRELDTWPEQHVRGRRWHPPGEAALAVKYPGLRAILNRVRPE